MRGEGDATQRQIDTFGSLRIYSTRGAGCDDDSTSKNEYWREREKDVETSLTLEWGDRINTNINIASANEKTLLRLDWRMRKWSAYRLSSLPQKHRRTREVVDIFAASHLCLPRSNAAENGNYNRWHLQSMVIAYLIVINELILWQICTESCNQNH